MIAQTIRESQAGLRLEWDQQPLRVTKYLRAKLRWDHTQVCPNQNPAKSDLTDARQSRHPALQTKKGKPFLTFHFIFVTYADSRGCDWEPWLSPNRLNIRFHFKRSPSRRCPLGPDAFNQLTCTHQAGTGPGQTCFLNLKGYSFTELRL